LPEELESCIEQQLNQKKYIGKREGARVRVSEQVGWYLH
jgi:hypothetical protein